MNCLRVGGGERATGTPCEADGSSTAAARFSLSCVLGRASENAPISKTTT